MVLQILGSECIGINVQLDKEGEVAVRRMLILMTLNVFESRVEWKLTEIVLNFVGGIPIGNQSRVGMNHGPTEVLTDPYE